MFCRKFLYAFRGIGKALREELSFRVMAGCFALVIAAGLLLNVTALEWAVLLLCCGAVLAAELINTAIERAVDIAAPEKHPLAEAAKDIAAGAVLVMSLFAAAVGLIIFLPHIIALLAQ
jgi:diacylglycerol kinase